jgi:hypothetical protein
MARWPGAVLALLLGPSLGAAHEFWIVPNLGDGRPAQVTFAVHIGEGLQGEVYPFIPAGYERAVWATPEGEHSLLDVRPVQGALAVQTGASGLYAMGVSSFPQTLEHVSQQVFLEYVADIGAELPASQGAAGTLREKYRRRAKTLVRVGTALADDRPLGLPYEWLRSDGRFTLAVPEGVAVPGRATDLTCRDASGRVQETRLMTDATGAVTPKLPADGTCLLNTVILSKQENHWFSDWVSVFFET